MSIVNTPILKVLWKRANANPEAKTTAFWEAYINSEFPIKDNYAVASQQPPNDAPGNLRRVDLTVDKLINESLLHRLFIFEAKKSSASQSEIDDLEIQGFEACVQHLRYTEREHMYAMTVIGTSARLWIAHIGEGYLTPWIPKGITLSYKAEYIPAHSNDGYRIAEGFKYIRKHPSMEDDKVAALRHRVVDRVEKARAGTTKYSSSPEISSSPLASPSNTYPNLRSGASLAPVSSYTPIPHPYLQAPSSSSQNSALPTRSLLSVEPAAATTADSPPLHGPPDAVEVDCKYNKKEKTFSFTYGKKHYIRSGGDLKLGIALKRNQSYVCFVYQGSSTGLSFWFFSPFDDQASPAVSIMFEDQGEGRETIYHFTHGDREYVVSAEDWMEGVLIENGYAYDCYHYSEDREQLFWTRSINTGEMQRWKGKERAH